MYGKDFGDYMIGDKYEKLAHTILNYSLKLNNNSRVLVSYTKESSLLVESLINESKRLGIILFLDLFDPKLDAMLSETNDDRRIELLRRKKEFEVGNFDCFISIRYNYNDYEGKNVPKEMVKRLGIATSDLNDVRINERDWVLLSYPSNVDAYKAKMSTVEFENYAFDVMNVDYAKMSDDIKPLKELMEKTDRVRIVGPNTDISFSIKGMPAIACTGEKNIPDGELYTAPVRESVNGVITYNTPSPYQGNVFHDVSLTFKDGKIIKAVCSDDDLELNQIFDSDLGARYVGEFSLGFNPKILYPMGDILYDEKILGSLHFTPGRCYRDCDNGNRSSIHWDMVLIQRKEFGGGEIYFDDVLIRKDGKFTLDSLKQLNYDME